MNISKSKQYGVASALWLVVAGTMLSQCHRPSDDSSEAIDSTDSPPAKKPAGPPTYKIEDVDWDSAPEAKPYKAQVIAGMNRMVRENKRCKSIGTYSVAKAVDQFSKKTPIFYVTCTAPDGQQFGATFNANDVGLKKASFAAAEPIPERLAVGQCEKAAIDEAVRPGTVSFIDSNFQTWPDGRARMVKKFSTENRLGMKIEYIAICYFKGYAMIEHNIKGAID